jgi:hypothetical protein
MGNRRAALGVVAAFTVYLYPAHAHVELEQYSQQRVNAVVGTANVDITVEFRFTGPASLFQRKQMDTNGDGALSEEERQEYLTTIANQAEEGLRLQIDEKPCALIPLYDPELDILDSTGIEAHPHVLRLHYFARTPESLHVGSTILLDSHMWTDTPWLVASSVHGSDGIEISGAPNPGLRRPSKEPKSIRVLEAKCVSKGEG